MNQLLHNALLALPIGAIVVTFILLWRSMRKRNDQ